MRVVKKNAEDNVEKETKKVDKHKYSNTVYFTF